MDRAEYYRILGIQQGASRAQIDRAYNERMKRLRSSDFADEREYADRKLRELKYAYSVVAGGAAPISEHQKLAHHARRKDDMEIAETADSFFGNLGGQAKAAAERVKQSAQSVTGHHPEGSHSHRKDKVRGAYQDESQSRSRKGAGGQRLVNDGEGARRGGQPLVKSFDVSADGGKALKTVVGIIVLLLAIVPSMIGSCESNRYPDYTFGEAEIEDSDWEATYNETVQIVDQLMYERVSDFDYDGWLDDSEAVQYQDQIVGEIVLEEGEEIPNYTDALAQGLCLPSAAAALAYLTGEEDFYWYNDDGQNADVLAEQLMQAPGFDEIAGAVNLYRDERILDEGAYLRFLVDVANSQTISVLYG